MVTACFLPARMMIRKAREKQKAELDFRASGKERRYAWDYDENFELYERLADGKVTERLTDVKRLRRRRKLQSRWQADCVCVQPTGIPARAFGSRGDSVREG